MALEEPPLLLPLLLPAAPAPPVEFPDEPAAPPPMVELRTIVSIKRSLAVVATGATSATCRRGEDGERRCGRGTRSSGAVRVDGHLAVLLAERNDGLGVAIALTSFLRAVTDTVTEVWLLAVAVDIAGVAAELRAGDLDHVVDTSVRKH
ncbi:hypothetical protein KC350_g65 [Hortaea werneckii]|nr:hypothetical protein KC350_g65 [Hortaea werneckii]